MSALLKSEGKMEIRKKKSLENRRQALSGTLYKLYSLKGCSCRFCIYTLKMNGQGLAIICRHYTYGTEV